MGFVHVGLNFEDEGRELIAAGVNGLAGQAVHAGQRGGGEAEEVLKEGLDAEVGQRRAEEHGAQLAAQHAVEVKFLGSTVQKLNFVHQLLVQVGGQQFVQCGIAQLSLGFLDLLDAVGAAVAGESKHFAGVAVEHALELLAAADGPVHGVGLDAVSYTHLDVYKRQLQRRVPCPQRGRLRHPQVLPGERLRLRSLPPADRFRL